MLNLPQSRKLHFITGKLLVQITFWHIFCCYYFIDQLFIIKVNDNYLELKQATVIKYGTFFIDAFRTFDFNMIILRCKNIPYLFGNSDVIVILLFFLINDSIKILILFHRDIVKTFIISNKLMVNFSWMFFTYFFMFFFIILF